MCVTFLRLLPRTRRLEGRNFLKARSHCLTTMVVIRRNRIGAGAGAVRIGEGTMIEMDIHRQLRSIGGNKVLRRPTGKSAPESSWTSIMTGSRPRPPSPNHRPNLCPKRRQDDRVRRRKGATALCYVVVAGFHLQVAHAQQPAPAYKLFPYDEDYRYLREPANRTDLWDSIKYIPLGSNPAWFLSFGGEIRERFEYYSYPNLGLQGQAANGYLLQRILLNVDLQASDYFRVFVQLGSHLAPWKDAAAPPYLDRLDLQQAFIDIRLPLGIEPDPILRIGRQEMVYGSQRLVSIRDAPNVRRNFDGLRLGGMVRGVRVDAFATRPVLQRSGVFDDSADTTQAFWGVYSTTPLTFVPGGNLDFYYLGYVNQRARFAAGAGEELRHTIGARFFGVAAGWDWDWEALAQFGTFAAQNIQAWGVSTDTGYTFDVKGWKFRLGLKADFGSGDNNLNDGTLGTMNPLFPKLAYFNQAAILGPSNVLDLQPTLSFRPLRDVIVTLGYDFVWRATTADAIYTGAGVPITGSAGQPGAFTGSQLTADLAWQVNRHVQLSLGYVHFGAGSTLRMLGGHDDDFVYFSGAYRF